MGKGMNNSIKKGVVVAVILLFFSVSVIPSTGNRVSFDDTTPPVTTCTLNPPEPNGENGWYVSDVKVTLNATDDMSGVNVTYWRIDGGAYQIYTEPFNVPTDGEHTVEYRSVDNAGNVEDWKSVEFKIDQTPPMIDLTWENSDNVYIGFTATCSEATSGIDRVEFYMNDVLQFIDESEPYEWILEIDVDYSVTGFICNLQITEENVSFFAICVLYHEFISTHMPFYMSIFKAIVYDYAGNSAYYTVGGESPPNEPPITFTHFTFPNDYRWYIGRFLIRATFENEPLEINKVLYRE